VAGPAGRGCLQAAGNRLLTYNALTSLDLPIIVTVILRLLHHTREIAMVDLVYAWLDRTPA
jgi:hypothetical protein